MRHASDPRPRQHEKKTNPSLSLPQSTEEVVKAKLNPKTRLVQLQEFASQPVVAAFGAGGVAGAVSRTVVSPLERLKILFQVQSAGHNEYKLGVGKALAKMWKEEGWRGFMAGNGTNCIRIVPYSAVQFGSYNLYKRVSTPSNPRHSSLSAGPLCDYTRLPLRVCRCRFRRVNECPTDTSLLYSTYSRNTQARI